MLRSHHKTIKLRQITEHIIPYSTRRDSRTGNYRKETIMLTYKNLAFLEIPSYCLLNFYTSWQVPKLIKINHTNIQLL